jgi:sugar lactone lactonase YvrE
MEPRMSSFPVQAVSPLSPGRLLPLAALLLAVAGVQAQGAYSFGPQPLAKTQGEQSVTVTASAAGAVSTVQVLTAGVAGLDFQKGSGASTCESAVLSAGATCQESVQFTPAAPGVRPGAVVLLDAQNNVLGTTYLAGQGTGGLGVLVAGNILPVAGDGAYLGAIADGGPATQAELNHPSSLALDGAGNMYIADKYHHRIRKVNASTGLISTIAGNDNPAYTGDGGSATLATLNSPWSVALDGAGNLYIADTGNNVIRRIAASTGIIATVAGTGTVGYSGDGGPATAANLNQPQGVTVDAAGNLYIADTFNHRIRRVDAVSGSISTVAGNGFTNPNGSGGYAGDGGPAVDAELNCPFAVAFDSAGNMYIPDASNNVVRVVDPSGVIATFAGTGEAGFSGDGAAATAAQMWSPSGVAVDPAGNVYIADTQNNCIRKVSLATGFISTIAANAAGEFYYNGNFYKVGIYGPIGLTLDSLGDLFFADTLNMRIREIQSNFVAIDFTAKPTRQGDRSATKNQSIENDGNGALDLSAINPDSNAALDPNTTTCVAGGPALPVNGDCVVGAVFAPTVAGDPLGGNIDVADDGGHSPLDIQVIGIATPVNSTTVGLSSSLNPSRFGQTITFTATVTTGQAAGTPTGTVTFKEDGAVLQASVPLSKAGLATYTTPALTVGLHSIVATYSGDATHFPSTSTDFSTAPLNQAVFEATATSLFPSVNPAALGQNVTFTATVTISGGGGVVPDGTVTFSDGTTVLGIIPLSAAGTALYTTTIPLAQGAHTISAAYSGDPLKQILASTSTFLLEDMQGATTAQVSIASSQVLANPVVLFGNPVTFTATVTGGGNPQPTGKVVFFDGANPIGAANLGAGSQATFTTSSLSIGAHSITVGYQGDSNYAPSVSSPAALSVSQAQTSAAVTAQPNPGIAGAPVALTAAVKVILGAATPTGTVTFTDGSVPLGSAAVAASGMAAVNPVLAPGTHSIVATYAGDKNDQGSASAPLTLTVQQATTSVTLSSTPNPALVLAAVAFTAKVADNGGIPTGSVAFSADGKPIGAANLDATGTATLSYSALPAGVHSITASYAGDVNDAASASSPLSQTVGTIPTSTSLGVSSTKGPTAQLILVASVLGSGGPTPTGTVTFSNGSKVLGSAPLDSTGIATLTPELGAGSYSVVAAYGGDALHGPSSSPPVPMTGTPDGFNLTVTPASVTIATTKYTTVTVGIASVSGFSDTIGLGCASLPAGVTCHFSSPSVALKANADSTAQLTIDTNNPLTGGASAMNSPPDRRTASLAALFLPSALFFGLVFRRFRRRNRFLAPVLLLLLSAVALAATACSSFTQASAAPGTYTIQVTGTGLNSNIVHYETVTLNITH